MMVEISMDMGIEVVWFGLVLGMEIGLFSVWWCLVYEWSNYVSYHSFCRRLMGLDIG